MIRTNHIRILLGLFLILALGMTVNAQQPGQATLTEEDYDLILLENGDVAEDEFLHPYEARLYGFNGSEGDNVTITMIQDPNIDLDPYIVLLNASGNVLAADDDSGQVSRSSEIRNFELPDDGTYLILATSWNGRREQPRPEDIGNDVDELPFQISVRGNRQPRDLDPDEFELTVSQMDIGDGRTLTLDARRQVAMVAIELLEGDVVSFDARPQDQSIDTLIYLFGETGLRIAANDDRASGNYSSLIDNFEIQDDGFYLVFVTVYNFYDATETNLNLGEIDFRVD